MNIKKTLIVFWYLLKNYILNSIFRKHRFISLFFIGVIVFIAVVVAITGGSFNRDRSEHNYTSASALRRLLKSYGVDKYVIIDLLSTLTLTYFALCLIFEFRLRIIVMSEAEYEVLLSQPIDMSTYILAKRFSDLIQIAWMSIFMAGFIPYSIQLSGGNYSKPLLIPVSLMLLFIVLGSLSMTLSILAYVIREKLRYVKLILILYMASGLLHSLYIGWISPILSAPLKPAFEAIIYCLTITEDVGDVLLAYVKVLVIIVLLNILIVKASNYIHPELIQPITVGMAERRKRVRESVEMRYLGPADRVVFNYVCLAKVAGRGNITFVFVSTALAFIAGYVLANCVPDPEFLVFVSSVLTPMIVSQVIEALVNASLALDLPSMWIYRVYMLSIKPFISSLVLRYSAYISEGLLILAVFNFSLTRNPAHLLLPLTVLPSTVIVSYVILLVAIYFASRRKVVKKAPTGLYVTEGIVVSILLIVFMPAFLIADLVYKLLLNILPVEFIVLSSAVSLAIALAIHEVLANPIAGFVEKIDIRT